MRWLGVKSKGSAIPTTLGLLRLVYGGDVPAIAIYVTAALKSESRRPGLSPPLCALHRAAVTAASYWHTHFRAGGPADLLYLQRSRRLADHRRGAHDWRGDSDLAGLYRHPGAVTALLMPPANAGLVNLFGVSSTSPTFSGPLPRVSASIWIQLGVFACPPASSRTSRAESNVLAAVKNPSPPRSR